MGFGGVYIHTTDTLICENDLVCIHEEGHRLDNYLGYPSQTEAFENAVDQFPLLANVDNTCIIKTRSCKYSEAYANLYMVVLGDIDKMPEDFREYYR